MHIYIRVSALCGLALALTLDACAHAPPVIGHRVCDGPMGIRFDVSASQSVREATERAMDYWAKELGWVPFATDPGGPIVVRQAERARAGHIRYRWEGGCLRSAVITIASHSTGWRPEVLETVLRHELGHALGLPDVVGPTLMGSGPYRYDMFIAMPHPYDIDALALDALRRHRTE